MTGNKTKTKRTSFVCAVVCALVLLGGSRAALAGDLGGWNPINISAHRSVTDNVRKVTFYFDVLAAKNDSYITPTVCGCFYHKFQYHGGWEPEPCNPDEVNNKGNGAFEAIFTVPNYYAGQNIVKTFAKVKLKWVSALYNMVGDCRGNQFEILW